MKTKIALLIVSFFLIAALPGWAEPTLPVAYDDVVQLYGSPDISAPHANGPNNTIIGTKFAAPDGTEIRINDLALYFGVRYIHYLRQTPYNEMEVESFLKPLSLREDWVKKDDKTWMLPKAHVEADWDGEGKLNVTALAK